MKKTLLIASVVAMAMGAWGQVDEWYNPFEELGAYNYVQKQSDGEIGKWFLSGENANDKYPILVEKNNKTYLGVESGDKEYIDNDIHLSILIDVRKFPKGDNNNLNIKFHINSINRETMQFFHTKEFKNIDLIKKIKDIKWICEDYGIGQGYDYDVDFDVNVNDSSNYVRMQISSSTDFYINNIEITGNNNESQGTSSYKEYFKYEYFNESYTMESLKNTKPNAYNFFENYVQECNNNYTFRYLSYKDIIEGDNGTLLTTSINNNDMESNTYVSNNILYTDEPSSVYIFNTSGILVKTENNTTSVDLSTLKKGVYIAKVNEKTIKFVR